MKYSDYKNKLLKRKAFLKKYKKFIPVVAIAIGLVIASIVVLFVLKGNASIVTTNISFESGGTPKIEVNAFMSDYKIFYENKDHSYSSTPEELPGEYKLMVETSGLFTKKYTEGVYEVKGKKLIVSLLENEIEYGKNPGFKTDGLKPDDQIESVNYNYDSLYLANTCVTLADAKVVNKAGEDVTAYYDITYPKCEITFTKCPIEIEIDSYEKVYDGTPLDTLTYRVKSKLFYMDKIEVELSGSQLDAGCTEIAVDSIKVFDNAGNEIENYKVSFNQAKLTVIPLEIEVVTGNYEKEYDGKIYESPYTIPTVYDDYTVTYDQEILVGENPNKIIVSFKRGDLNVSGNYDIKYSCGLIVVNRRKITVTPKAVSVIYSGNEVGFTEIESIDNLVEGDVAKVTSSVKYTEAGHYKTDNDAFGINITSNGKIITNQYEITYEKGTIDISKKVISISPINVTYEYTGEEITCGTNAYKVSADTPLIGEDKLRVYTSVKKIAIGEYDYEITAAEAYNGTTIISNYDIKPEGSAKLKIIEVSLIVKASNESYTYDRTNHSITSGKITSGNLLSGHEIEYKSSLAYKAVGKYDDVKLDLTIIKDSNGNDVTSFYNVEHLSGTLEIKKIDITVALVDMTKEYNGSEGITYDTSNLSIKKGSLLDGDTLSYVGELAFVDVSDNPYKVELTNDMVNVSYKYEEKDYYEIKTIISSLIITKRRLVLKAKSISTKYVSGVALTLQDYDIKSGSLAKGDAIFDVVINSSLDVIGKTPNVIESVVIKSGTTDKTKNYEIVKEDGELEYVYKYDYEY